MLKMQVLGNLTDSPKQFATQSGVPFVAFCVAHNERDRNGESHAVFVNCTAWCATTDANGKQKGRDTGGVIARYFRKGDCIYVEGTPTTSYYTNAQGDVVTKLNLRVSDFQFCGKTSGGQQAMQSDAAEPENAAYQPPVQQQMTAVETDDLPF